MSPSGAQASPLPEALRKQCGHNLGSINRIGEALAVAVGEKRTRLCADFTSLSVNSEVQTQLSANLTYSS